MPMLDDRGSKVGWDEDEKFIVSCNEKFGLKEGKNKKAKDKMTKMASEYYFGHRKKHYIFFIVHYAGNIEYNARDFLAKNQVSAASDARLKRPAPKLHQHVALLLVPTHPAAQMCCRPCAPSTTTPLSVPNLPSQRFPSVPTAPRTSFHHS